MNAPQPVQQRNRNRAMLIAIFVIFLGSFFFAGALRFSGWRPSGLKNHGELLQPPADLRNLAPTLVDGSAYPWNPVERTWRIVVAPPADCAEACVKLARQIDLVWQLFGHDANHVHVLWMGEPPAALPRVDDIGSAGRRGVPVYVVDPNGFAILRYAPGFDPGDLRSDVARLLKLQ